MVYRRGNADSPDHNIYVFDARNFNRAQNIHKGHVAAVMDVEFSPTGEELVSGSYVSLRYET